MRPRTPKHQSLNFVNGYMMVNPRRLSDHSAPATPMVSLQNRPMTASAVMKETTDPNDVTGRYSFARRRVDRTENKISLPFCAQSSLPLFIKHDRRVLLFDAYFEEDVQQCAIETTRLHKCEIFFYVEDGTIEIIQKKLDNSGMPQGTFLRRSKVPKHIQSSGLSTEYYGVDDFHIGSDIVIYSRNFNIVNCNESTRQYLFENHGRDMNDLAARPFPRDQFAEVVKEKMSRESGKPGVNRNRKMHELKQIMESMLGKPTSMTDRGMFLECGSKALCFDIVWDDRERLYGDLQFFRLQYFLSDDTIEILPVHGKLDGRDHFPKLLNRSKLPKHKDSNEFYTWNDLAIGETINVYGRSMLIAKCDKFTRSHYESEGIPLDPDMSLEQNEDVPVLHRIIPPYNGFGSEEDSLRSCTGGLNPPPPKRDIAKQSRIGIVLRFNAKLLSDKDEDFRRRFVIQYFMEDDTISIMEPPVRNSGLMGGKFLRRQVQKKPDGSRYGPSDMYVGNEVEFVCHKFVLQNADEYSYRIMENDDRTFPFSNFSRLHSQLMEKLEDIKHYFVASYTGDGMLDIDEFECCCKMINLRFNKQELITLWRKIDRKGKGRVTFTKLIKLASDVPIHAPFACAR
eukprot:CAMPEP_0196822484 /NCGR_PEP_ID=MMETSP1362-20130617/83644_1 /TAXON_ID=163516 /ORGANISM="Leptocylindrus danicus, Strain CCMP1856" /LENGTH=623 /DNA_ID=CAMNT_0042202049 /DNA_START=1028 /DNA_END=2899 /DNA_ORIENTATION=+